MLGPQSVLLLSGIAGSADGDGSWYYIGNWRPPFSIITLGIVSGDKTQVWVSNNASDSPPAAFTAAAGALQLGSDITADGKTAVTETYTWVCIRKTAHSGGGDIVARAAALVV